jgi:hypothetical protein
MDTRIADKHGSLAVARLRLSLHAGSIATAGSEKVQLRVNGALLQHRQADNVAPRKAAPVCPNRRFHDQDPCFPSESICGCRDSYERPVQFA